MPPPLTFNDLFWFSSDEEQPCARCGRPAMPLVSFLALRCRAAAPHAADCRGDYPHMPFALWCTHPLALQATPLQVLEASPGALAAPGVVCVVSCERQLDTAVDVLLGRGDRVTLRGDALRRLHDTMRAALLRSRVLLYRFMDYAPAAQAEPGDDTLDGLRAAYARHHLESTARPASPSQRPPPIASAEALQPDAFVPFCVTLHADVPRKRPRAAE